ncbi:MAG: phosphatidate cytidylyltransferase [Candidatus Bipolaricaulota bacterium]|nr:phosphatidate cytidylyltransferase [Candidatus Bipolaricaulota bacterium]
MNLVKRIVSGVIACAVVLGVVYVGARFDVRWIAGALILGVAYLTALEYLHLMKKLDIPLAAPEFLIWIPLLVLSYLVLDGRYADVVLLFAISYQVLRYLAVTPHRTGFLQAVAGVFGLLYIPWLLHYFYLIYLGAPGQSPMTGAAHGIVVLLMVFGYDSGSFFVGSAIGRHKAFPNVSPSKTWEGVAGGFVFTVLAVMVGALLDPLWRDFVYWKGFPHVIVSSVCVGWAVQLGDVFASKLKRAAGVKDSGVFLPGHGGALDRIDGLLFALPVFYFYYHYILHFL